MNAEQAIADHQRMLIHAAEDRQEISALRARVAELESAARLAALKEAEAIARQMAQEHEDKFNGFYFHFAKRLADAIAALAHAKAG